MRPFTANDRKGQTNKAATFDGAGDYIDTNAATSSVLNITGSGLTVAVWFKTNNISTIDGQYIAGNLFWDNSLKHGGYVLLICATKRIGLGISTSVSKYTSACADGGANLDDNKWHFAVLAYDGSRLKLYVDMIVQSDQAVTGTINSSTKKFWIGSQESYNTPYFDGKIDDVRIYNQALGLSRIQQLYAQGIEKHKIAVK